MQCADHDCIWFKDAGR